MVVGGGVDEVEVHIGSLVHVGENEGGADGGFGVESRTAVAVPASSDLEVEGAVHPVLLRTEDRCQVLRHLWLRVWGRNEEETHEIHTPKFCPFTNKFGILGAAHVAFCSKIEKFDGFSGNKLSESEHETLELLNKPSIVPIRNGSSSEVDREKASTQKEEALEPFLKFFKASDSLEVIGDSGVLEVNEESETEEEEDKKVNDEYYEPKPGDFVVGVIVRGNENKLSVNVGEQIDEKSSS